MEKNKKITLEEVKELLPYKTYLYYVDYNDNLNNFLEEIQQCIHNANFDALDYVLDWDTFEEEESYIVKLRKDLYKKYNKTSVDAFVYENRDEIAEIIREKDDSENLVSQLLRNTSGMACFYDLNVYMDEYTTYKNKSMEELKKALKIKVSNTHYDNELTELLENAMYDGRLVIYFYIEDWEDLIIECIKSNKIIFSGDVTIAIINNNLGSGHSVELKDFCFHSKFNEENIYIDDCVKYSFVSDVCGMDQSFCKGTKFELSKISNHKKVKNKEKTELQLQIEQNARYEKTFKNGGCTFGDMNITRHRETYYINDFPCGTKCKNCGTFFVD